MCVPQHKHCHTTRGVAPSSVLLDPDTVFKRVFFSEFLTVFLDFISDFSKGCISNFAIICINKNQAFYVAPPCIEDNVRASVQYLYSKELENKN